MFSPHLENNKTNRTSVFSFRCPNNGHVFHFEGKEKGVREEVRGMAICQTKDQRAKQRQGFHGEKTREIYMRARKSIKSPPDPACLVLIIFLHCAIPCSRTTGVFNSQTMVVGVVVCEYHRHYYE